MTAPGPRPGWPPRSLVGDLPDPLRAELLHLGTPRTFTRGEIILAENDLTTEVFVLVTGFVRVLNHTHSGEQAMIAIRTRGDLIGELAAMDGRPRVSTVIAASRTTARIVDGPRFRSFVAAHPPVGDAVARSVVAKLRTATRYRVENSQATVLTRVARVLAHLADAYGRPVVGGVLVDVPLPQRDLASLVGASEKGISRAYLELRQHGAIEVTYRRVVVSNPELLHRYADAE